MKLLLILLTLATLGLTGCTITTPPAEAPLRIASKNAVEDVDIRLAMFGSGLAMADVTDKVIQLLRSDKAGFTVRGDTLGEDPLPYSSKCLVIDYYYKGKPFRYAVVAQQHVSYDLLVKNAGR